MIKKADILLLTFFVVFGLFASLYSVFGTQDGAYVIVTVDNEVYGEYDLSKDREIVVETNGHTNNITISGGKVQMASSTCKNQVCVNQGVISKTHQVITCLPNKVMVEIVSNEKGGLDVISD